MHSIDQSDFLKSRQVLQSQTSQPRTVDATENYDHLPQPKFGAARGDFCELTSKRFQNKSTPGNRNGYFPYSFKYKHRRNLRCIFSSLNSLRWLIMREKKIIEPVSSILWTRISYKIRNSIFERVFLKICRKSLKRAG